MGNNGFLWKSTGSYGSERNLMGINVQVSPISFPAKAKDERSHFPDTADAEPMGTSGSIPCHPLRSGAAFAGALRANCAQSFLLKVLPTSSTRSVELVAMPSSIAPCRQSLQNRDPSIHLPRLCGMESYAIQWNPMEFNGILWK